MGILNLCFIVASLILSAALVRMGYVWGWNARERAFRDQKPDWARILRETIKQADDELLRLRALEPDDPKDVDQEWFDVLCPTCAFFNSVQGRQLRLEETIICTGCHESFPLKKGETMIKVHL